MNNPNIVFESIEMRENNPQSKTIHKKSKANIQNLEDNNSNDSRNNTNCNNSDSSNNNNRPRNTGKSGNSTDTNPAGKYSKWRENSVLITGDSMPSKINEKTLSSRYPIKVRSFPAANTVKRNNADGQSITGEGKAHPWPKGTILITGDSIISGIAEKKFTGPTKVKVRSFPGATIMDMRDHIKPLVRKKPAKIILHIATNDATDLNADQILEELLELKSYIEMNLPSCHVITSMPTMRCDNRKANKVIQDLNEMIANLNIDRVENYNINESDLFGSIKLHVNTRGSEKLATNFANKLCLYQTRIRREG